MEDPELEEPDLEEIDEPETLEAGSPLRLTAVSSDAGQRLDLFVTLYCRDLTRSEVQRWIAIAHTSSVGIHVNGRPEKPGTRLKAGDQIEISPPAAVSTRVLPEAIPLTVCYEDSDLMVIDKPRGMVVHPAPGALSGTLVNAVLAHAGDLSGIGGELRPGIVHRLDKDTGGLIMVAKNDLAHRHLQAQIQSRNAQRRYQALVWGVPSFRLAKVDAPIGRHPIDRKKMAVITSAGPTAREAQTELTVQRSFHGMFSLLEAKLQTGRTHQIRVHCSYIQHPIVGDPLYGGVRKLSSSSFPSARQPAIERAIEALQGQALHAYALSFDHPRTGKRLDFSVPLPTAMTDLIALLEAAGEK